MRPRAKKKKKKGQPSGVRVQHPNAAGADIGATEVYVAVPLDRDPEAVRFCSTFTGELEKMVDWLVQCGIQTVAMEATSVYWIPLAEMLEARKIEVCLVNARHVKHVPGRKSDVQDCQWLQELHSLGLLSASFRPPQEIRPLRTLWRHRESLVQMASQRVMHIHKALDQMNLQVHHVLSDITGVSGLAILDAILEGERDPETLADLCHPTVRSSPATMAQALTGHYQGEHLFTLRQMLTGYRQCLEQIREVDWELEGLMRALPNGEGVEGPPPASQKPSGSKRQHHAPAFDLRGELYRVVGVDLTEVPGLSSVTVETLLTEIGPNVSRFRSAAAFASWLGLCPDRRVSGGKLLSTRTRPLKSRVARALRMAAQSLHHAQNPLGDFFRRMKRRIGAPEAITATAHKLARIVYHLLSTKQPFDPAIYEEYRRQTQAREESKLRRQARRFGYQLVPLAA